MNIKSYITFLSRNKVYTAINVFGLSLSLMFVMLIGVYVWQEYSVDRQHSKAERIYTLGIDMGGDDRVIGVSRQVAPYLKSRYPEIEMTCGVARDRDIDLYQRLPVGEEIWVVCGFHILPDIRLPACQRRLPECAAREG